VSACTANLVRVVDRTRSFGRERGGQVAERPNSLPPATSSTAPPATRGTAASRPRPRHPRFDREIEERLLYGKRAVMGKPMRECGTAEAYLSLQRSRAVEADAFEIAIEDGSDRPMLIPWLNGSIAWIW
jgi:hypothetical protein